MGRGSTADRRERLQATSSTIVPPTPEIRELSLRGTRWIGPEFFAAGTFDGVERTFRAEVTPWGALLELTGGTGAEGMSWCVLDDQDRTSCAEPWPCSHRQLYELLADPQGAEVAAARATWGVERVADRRGVIVRGGRRHIRALRVCDDTYQLEEFDPHTGEHDDHRVCRGDAGALRRVVSPTIFDVLTLCPEVFGQISLLGTSEAGLVIIPWLREPGAQFPLFARTPRSERDFMSNLHVADDGGRWQLRLDPGREVLWEDGYGCRVCDRGAVFACPHGELSAFARALFQRLPRPTSRPRP